MICPTNNQPCGWRCQTVCTSDDTRLTIESGTTKHVGPTFAERLAAHERGECDAMCGICYHEADALSGSDGNG